MGSPAALSESGLGSSPPPLRASLRLGARICGEACRDPGFNVADEFIVLDMDHIPAR
jgi:putative hemolysin